MPRKRNSKTSPAASPIKSLSPAQASATAAAPAAIEPTTSASDRGDLNRFLPNHIPAIVHKQSWVQNEWQAFLTGIMFFTRLPCPPWVDHNLYWISQSTVYFPVIGVIVGLFGALAYSIGNLFWHPMVGVFASTLATVWLTGAFHEDGLCDSFDGFGGGWSRSDILRIMRDSRLGTYGCIGLVLVLGTKLTALSLLLVHESIPALATPLVLVVGHVMGRWACVYLLFAHEYLDDAGESAPGKHFVLHVTKSRLVVGTVSAFAFVLAAMALAPGGLVVPRLAVVWVASSIVTVVAGRYITGILGGVIGDALGATNQIVEVVGYLCLAMRPWEEVVARILG
ncbi:cobalamin-5-phosphate synthase-domain-containing protein [Catenaria anguillulae PL171]|uniref:Adenosylcobinamide-GDP ribazoletransferase n=1 Tax=Catenaria anguillulae PL171 TaxID=765915 RepID=A0A1Y2HKH6_9FUNG|nr:cobalamin-5-phosphate synthase-domain-containing protein [Catenaria anguillulae PL171]